MAVITRGLTIIYRPGTLGSPSHQTITPMVKQTGSIHGSPSSTDRVLEDHTNPLAMVVEETECHDGGSSRLFPSHSSLDNGLILSSRESPSLVSISDTEPFL